jgi:hypothetical protein
MEVFTPYESRSTRPTSTSPCSCREVRARLNEFPRPALRAEEADHARLEELSGGNIEYRVVPRRRAE